MEINIYVLVIELISAKVQNYLPAAGSLAKVSVVNAILMHIYMQNISVQRSLNFSEEVIRGIEEIVKTKAFKVEANIYQLGEI